jgi:hypothetical protein
MDHPDPDDHELREARLDGPIEWWSGYRVSCGCGATGRWRLRVQQRPWTVGEQAWAVCPHDHHVNHPLIYPAMVHAVLRQVAAGGSTERLLDVVPDWMPHRHDVTGAGDHSDDVPVSTYWPWTHPHAGAWIGLAHPGLLAAYGEGLLPSAAEHYDEGGGHGPAGRLR